MFDQILQLPKSIKTLLAGLTGASLISIAMIDTRALLIVAIGIVLVGLAVVAWRLYLKWKGRQRAKALSGSLATHSAATSRSRALAKALSRRAASVWAAARSRPRAARESAAKGSAPQPVTSEGP